MSDLGRWRRYTGLVGISIVDADDLAIGAVCSGPERTRARRDRCDGWATVERSDESAPGIRRLGRYVVGPRVGGGFIGTVYEARDEQLGRKVALKVLNDGLGARHVQRLVREARACAKLEHPHVVSIYEVGEHEGRCYIAMEHVRGQTLRLWQASRPSWRDCVRAYRQAAEGLAAAHEAGLVHRDFKPEHCLVDDRGMLRVLGFGQSALPDEADEADDPAEPTRTETQWGTPEYMSPEQALGAPADALGDQYAFCVSMFEAVHGVSPFDDGAPGARLQAKMLGRISSAPRGRRVPHVLRELLRRGLQPDPRLRWSSMSMVAQELRRLESRRLGPMLGLGLGLGLAGALVIVGGVIAQPADSPEPCDGARARLDGVWDDERRVAVRDALVGTGRPHAVATSGRVRARLDERADAWVAAYTRVCEATARGEQSEEVLDVRMECLERRRVELGAAVEVLATVEPVTLERADDVVAGVRGPDGCTEAWVGGAEPVRPSEDDAEAVAEGEALVARALAERRAGRYEAALVTIDEASRALSGVQYEPVRTMVALERGMALEQAGEYEAAEITFRRALESASRQRQPGQIREAATMLMVVVGARLGRHDEGMEHFDLAWGLAQGSPLDEAFVLANAAVVQSAAGRNEDALASYERVLQVRLMAQGPYHPNVAAARRDLGLALIVEGRHEEARTQLSLALQVMEEALGPEHPEVALCRSSLAHLLSAQGRRPEAVEQRRRALEVWERAYGADSPRTIALGVELAEQLMRTEVGEEARALAERARSYPGELAPLVRARAVYVLARSSWRLASTPEQLLQARVLGEQARDAFGALGEAGTAWRDSAQAWLDSRASAAEILEGGEP